MKKKTTAAKGSSKIAAKYDKFRSSRFADVMYEKGVLYFLLSFIIPFVAMLIAFNKQDIAMLKFTEGKFQVTGDKQFLVVDLWHQYYPFFRVVREKLVTGGSFLYSWQNGMGTNFLALIAYYAASPLNWIAIFVKEEYARECLMYILAAKIGFCGAFMSCFLRYTFKRKDLSIVAFSVMFALCGYMAGYYWNVMWFDTVAVFPLVMLGVTALCRERKWKLYTVALALSLIFNYYVAFFTCIFTMFMFASAAIIEWKGIKDFFVKLLLIIRSSVIAIGLGAFMLLPAYLALKLTHSANNVFPKEVKWTDDWMDIFANLISFVPPTTKEGLPNLACGMLAITLLGVFLLAGGIKIREKVSSVLLMALIVVSCNENQLNFIWHGFHVTNQLPHRFAFIFSFVLVAAAYRAYTIMTEKGIKLYQLPLLFIGPIAEFYICYLSRKDTEDGFSFGEKTIKSSLYITAAYILIFICVKLLSIKDNKKARAVLNVALTAAVVVEMGKNAIVGVKAVGGSDRTSYPSYNTQVQQVLEVMRIRENKPFYRTELNTNYTLNDSALYGYNGLSQFSSSANESVTRLFMRLGMYGSEAGNRFYYRTSTPVVHALLGMDYVIGKLGPIKSSSAFLNEVTNIETAYLYENKYPLSLGFMMDERVLDIPDSGGRNPFEYQNDIIRRATGLDIDLFTAQPVQLADYANMTVNKTSYGEYNYTIEDRSVDSKATYDFAGVDGAYLYCYVKGGAMDNVILTCDGESVDSAITSNGYSIAAPFGEGQGGTVNRAVLKLKNDYTTGSYTFVTYALGEEAFRQAYAALADEQLEITEFTDTKITGNINAKKDGVLYFSIPYEKGWSVYIDGQKAETMPVLDALLGVKASAGEHEIVLKYVPDGFVPGIIIGFGALFLFILFAYIDSRTAKKKAARALAEAEAAAEAEKEDAPEADEKADEDGPEAAEEISGEEKPEETAPEEEKAGSKPEKKPEKAPVKKNAPKSQGKKKGKKKK